MSEVVVGGFSRDLSVGWSVVSGGTQEFFYFGPCLRRVGKILFCPPFFFIFGSEFFLVRIGLTTRVRDIGLEEHGRRRE